MGNSRWNNGSSIAIADLNEIELKEAMKEWAEGNKELEELLWECHHNGVVTTGSHVGEYSAYVQFLIEDSSEKIKNILCAAWNFDNVKVTLDFEGNPFSGPDWYKSTISISPKRGCEASKLFACLTESLNNPEVMCCSNPFVHSYAIYHFLDGKESDLTFNFEKEDNKFSISIVCFGNTRNWNNFSEIFVTARMSEERKEEKGLIRWSYQTKDEEEFNSIIINLLETLKIKWNLSLPNEINNDMTLTSSALVMRRKFGTDQEGIKRFNEWLEEERRSWFSKK